jgi:hypothetical protein
MLERKDKKFLYDKDCKVMIPSYCPDFQPIEFFLAAGAHHMAMHLSPG